MSILKGSEYNFENLTFGKPKVNQRGGKSLRISDAKSGRWLMISTPKMRTFGINDYEDPQTGVRTGKFEISQYFPSTDYETPELKSFLENLKNFELSIKKAAVKNSKAWFGKEYNSIELIDILFSPILKYPKDKTTSETDYTKPPCFRSKVRCYEDDWKCELYDENKVQVFPNSSNPELKPYDILKAGEGVNIATIISCSNLWIVGGRFGVTLELFQGVIFENEAFTIVKKPKGCLLNISSNEEGEEEKDEEKEEENNMEEEPTVELKIGEEEEIKKEEEPVVEQKKVVRKKK